MATEETQEVDQQQPDPELEARAEQWEELLAEAGLDREEMANLFRRGVAIDQSAEMLAGLGPQNEEELYEWFKERIGVEIPRVAVCPGHSSLFEIACEIHFFKVLRL